MLVALVWHCSRYLHYLKFCCYVPYFDNVALVLFTIPLLMEDLNIIIVLLASLSLRLSSLSFDFKDIAYEQIH